jgi:hypothetical protein
MARNGGHRPARGRTPDKALAADVRVSNCMRCRAARLRRVHPVRDCLRFRGGGEDRARVVFQDFKRGCEIGRAIRPRMVRDAEIGQDETRRQFHIHFCGGEGA